MAEVVDSIVAELIARTSRYEAGFDRAIAKHEEFMRSLPKLDGIEISKGAQTYADRHRKAAGDVVKAEVETTEKVTRTRKARVTAAKATDEAEVASAKAAAKAKAQTERDAARESARVARDAAREKVRIEKAAAAEAAALAAKREQTEENSRRRTIGTYGDNPGLRRATGGLIGATVANEAHGQASIPASVLNGGAAPVAEAEQINRLAVDLIGYRASLAGLAGREKQQVQDLIAEMTLEKRLLAENVAEEEILLRIEERRTLIAGKRAAEEKIRTGKAATRDGEQFARGAGAYAAVGGGAAIAGLVSAAAVAGVVDLTRKGLDYAQSLKAISDQLGITTGDLQKYQAVASTLGVTQEQLRESFSQLASNLGRAQEGSEAQSKIFARLNIDIGNSKTGFKSLSDVLPSFLDRLSKIPSQSQRLAIELALGGEQLRRLDPVLSKGADGFDQLAESVGGTSEALSDRQIQEAAATANKLKLLGDQLERDLSGVVANNATQILSLANAFFKLADGALKAFGAMQRYTAFRDLNNPEATPAERAAAQATIDSTHEGRVVALARVNASRAAIASMRGSGGVGIGRFNVDGIVDEVENTPAGRERALQQVTARGRQIIAAEQADRAASAPTPVQPGKPGDVSNLFSPKPHKGKKGKSQNTLDNEEEARNRRFADQLAGFQEAELRAQEEASGSIERRAEIEAALAERAYQRQLVDIEAQKNTNIRNGEDRKQAEQQARELAAAAKKARDAEVANIETKRQADIAQATTAHLETVLQIQSDMLGYQLSIATTAKARRDIELRLLDLSIQQERAAISRDRAALKPDDSRGRADLDAREAALPGRQAAQAAIINRNDASPLQDYFNRLPHTADEIREAFEKAAVSGIERVNDGLAQTLTNLIGIHGAAGEFLTDLIKIGIQILENKAAAGGGGGGFFGAIASAASAVFGGGGGQSQYAKNAAAFNLPGFASGGAFRVGGRPGVDRNVLSINGEAKARVGADEMVAVLPNVAASNRQAAQRGAGGVTVLQPINVDARGAVMNDQFARLILDQAGKQSQQISAAYSKGAVLSAPGHIQKVQDLGN